MTTRLTVVVVTYNSAEVIRGLLASLPAALEGVAEAEVLVVDNASTDDTTDIVEDQDPSARVIQNSSNLGYAAACNRGIVGSRDAAHVLLLNADMRPNPGSIQHLIRAIQDRAGLGIVVPRLVSDDGQTALSLRREPTVVRALGEAVLGGDRARTTLRLSEVVADREAYDHAGPADWATGAALLISMECLRMVGLLDESFFLYSEETDFALRARDAGYGLWFEPSSVMTHIGGEVHDNPVLWRLLTVNRVRLHTKRHGRIAGAAFWSAVVLNETLRLGRHPRHRAALRGLLSVDGLWGSLPPDPIGGTGGGGNDRTTVTTS